MYIVYYHLLKKKKEPSEYAFLCLKKHIKYPRRIHKKLKMILEKGNGDTC